MRSKLLLSVCGALCGCVLMASSVRATWVLPTHIKPTGPKWSMDLGRSITGIIEGVLTLCGDGDAKAELIATQEIVNQNADGTAGWEPDPRTITGVAAPTALQNGVYAYVKSEILDQTDKTKYQVFQNALSSPTNVGNSQRTCSELFQNDEPQKVCMAVVNTFFADKGEDNDHPYVAQRLKQRQEYAKKVSERHIELGYNIQQKAIVDLQVAAQAPVKSDNEVGSIAVDAQTLDEMLKITVADVALQIEMMEADAVAFLLQQPVEIMDQAKPATN